MSYLSILIVSTPILAANNRGENSGNGQTLQKVRTTRDTRTVLSGYAIKRAIRDHMQKAGANVWRETLDNFDPQVPAGYVYKKNEGGTSTDMVEAIPETAATYDDTILFGYMVAGKDVKDEYAGKQRAQVSVSPALSTTAWGLDVGFALGLKAKSGKDDMGPDLAPFTYERHYTRYQYTVTINLGGLSENPEAVRYLINALRGLQVGGNHASNASEVIPEVLAYRFHDEPGTGGLYLGAGLDFDPNDSVDLTALQDRLDNLGITNVEYAGLGYNTTVADALATLADKSVAAAKGA